MPSWRCRSVCFALAWGSCGQPCRARPGAEEHNCPADAALSCRAASAAPAFGGGLGFGHAPARAARLPRQARGEPPFPARPLLLEGAALGWPAARWSLAGLAERLAGEQVYLVSYGCYGEDEFDEDGEEREMLARAGKDQAKGQEDEEEGFPCVETVGDAGAFFRQLPSMRVEAASSAHHAGLKVLMLREDPLLFERRPDLWADVPFGRLLPRGGAAALRRRGYSATANLWAGPAGARTGLHADMVPTALLIHVGPGEKSVIILPPSAGEALGAGPELVGMARYAPPGLDLFAENATAASPAVAAWLGHPEVTRVTLRKGDVLLLPCGWFHQVQYEGEPSISVTLEFLPHAEAPRSASPETVCRPHTGGDALGDDGPGGDASDDA